MTRIAETLHAYCLKVTKMRLISGVANGAMAFDGFLMVLTRGGKVIIVSPIMRTGGENCSMSNVNAVFTMSRI